MNTGSTPLLVGEVFLDFTVTAPGEENKLRLGGIAHAARGFWALGIPFVAAAVVPHYLEPVTRKYFAEYGCVEFYALAHVIGAPNVIVIVDPTEVADQGYDALLRDEKHVVFSDVNLVDLDCSDVLVFPGTYDLKHVSGLLPSAARLHLDVAYDVADVSVLTSLPTPIASILISTSSPLFAKVATNGLDDLKSAFASVRFDALVLKENRGGSRVVVRGSDYVEFLPAQLGDTVNSVGVGDVFAAAYLSHLGKGAVEAAWRATYAAAAYSQTTFPDLFRKYVQRDLQMSLEELRDLAGVSLPWEDRLKFPIYLAAPDFSYGDRRAVDRALAALSYHNFAVRRPVVENGELPPGCDQATLMATYQSDCELLYECAMVFAVPTGRDPGTLVEIGIALEAGKRVIVYDPARENTNTMVIGGADYYSSNLDACLNAVFRTLSDMRGT